MPLKIPHPVCRYEDSTPLLLRCCHCTSYPEMKHQCSLSPGDSDLDAGRDLSFDKTKKKDIVVFLFHVPSGAALASSDYNGSFFVGMPLKIPPPVSVRCSVVVRTRSLHSCGLVVMSSGGCPVCLHEPIQPLYRSELRNRVRGEFFSEPTLHQLSVAP
jgi:hypothetical protein